jgi:hypothetical protein
MSHPLFGAPFAPKTGTEAGGQARGNEPSDPGVEEPSLMD